MPAIDINRVRAEAATLAQLYGDPENFVAGTREFFQSHSAPIYRQSSVVTVNAPLKTYGTPAPVLRAMVNALRKYATRYSQHTLTMAERLWADLIREQRTLAVELLGLTVTACPDEVAKVMIRWLMTLDDLELIDLLATQVGGPWLMGDLWGRLEEARRWVNSPHKHQRRFGVMMLSSLAKSRNFGDVLAVLEVMTGAMRENDLEVRKKIGRASCRERV